LYFIFVVKPYKRILQEENSLCAKNLVEVSDFFGGVGGDLGTCRGDWICSDVDA